MIESPTVSLDAKAEDKRNILLVFAGLMVTMLLASLDQMIFSTALPTIVGELHGVNHMLWVTTTYILASTIMLPIYGNLGDLIGRKGLFIGAIALFVLGSIIGGLSQNMAWLIGGRAVQGLGASRSYLAHQHRPDMAMGVRPCPVREPHAGAGGLVSPEEARL